MKGSKGILLLFTALMLCILLSACSRVIRSPADELCMYGWQVQMDNGNHLELRFNDDEAVFRAVNDAFRLTVSGSYLIDDSSFVISDRSTMMNYSFSYVLHGDCVELTYGDGTVKLYKKGL